MKSQFEKYFLQCPIIAILRGITPNNCINIANVLYDAGVRIIEVPLNSPKPFESIKLLKEYFNDAAIIGAGTVLNVDDVDHLQDIKADIVISPNVNIFVGRQAKKHGMIWLPGVFTPSEGFLALENGADGLKLFPAELISTQIIRAWKNVFPQQVKLIPVGGINATNIARYVQAGAAGFGIGGTIFKPEYTITQIDNKIKRIIREIR